MFDLKASTAAFVGNLVATRSTSITAAVVLGCTFMPMLGGVPKLYELREAAAWASGGASSSIERVVHPDWGGVQAIVAPTNGDARTRPASLTAAEVNPIELVSAEVEDAAIMPVVQTLEPEVELCVEECILQPLPPEEAQLMEIPEVEELEEIAPLELG